MNGKPQVLIIGAGYAGLNAALHLSERPRAERDACSVALVDQRPYHLIKIRLHEAAVRTTGITNPLHEVLVDDGVAFQQAVITGFDLGQRQVATTNGSLAYDYLLLALGSTTNFFGLPGLEEYSFRLDSLEDAVRLRGHIEQQVVLAADSTDPAERERRLRFVIGGAGYTGIELAGELADLLPGLCNQVGLPKTAGQILVVDASPRILPVLDEEASAYAAQELGKKGVQFRSRVKVTMCSPDGVTIDPGGFIPTATTVWAGGIRAQPLVASTGTPTGRQGRLVVDTSLRLPDHPDVFAAGDCALTLDPTTQQPIPATAQLALQEGHHAAENIAHALKGEPLTPFTASSHGEIVSLGSDRGVGWAKLLGDRQLKVHGLIGGLAKRAAEAEWGLHLWRETHHLDDILG